MPLGCWLMVAGTERLRRVEIAGLCFAESGGGLHAVQGYSGSLVVAKGVRSGSGIWREVGWMLPSSSIHD